MLNLRSVDLNLLPVFEAAYEERSLSRAAIRLAMTQPAVSHALSRLRAAFREELFVRHSRGMTPTPAADAIHARIGEALDLVRAAVDENRAFDPKASRRRYAVAIPHPLGPMLALRLLERMKALAPAATLTFSTRSRPVELERGLWEGRFDLSVDWLPPGREGFVEEKLAVDHLVVVARRGHPATRRRRSLEEIAGAWQFVTLRPRQREDAQPPEIARAWASVRPKVALEVSEFLEILPVTTQSDLLGILPATVAKAAARMMPLQVVPVTTATPSITVRMIWKAARGKDPAHRFLRDQVRAAMKEVLAK
jgi:DNA-binding transcriptional LysR family regulator